MKLLESHRHLFRQHNKPPYICHFCGYEVRTLAVHHLDGNHDNNDPANLAATHQACHNRHHVAYRREHGIRTKVRRDSTTGVRGIKRFYLSRLDPNSLRFLTRYSCLRCRRRFYVGRFTSEEAAVQAYERFERDHLVECEKT